MRIFRAAQFDKNYSKAPKEIQQLFDKQSLLLLQNLRYPSLRAKKIDEVNDVWQARVNKDWRFLFQIAGETYLILNIFPHPK
jgi:mRNA-degrading endonuclease RelE of RelBE toxin-antitoxin system